MNPESVFQKTEKGREEIAKRTHRLEARQRTMLILVDGKSNAGTLAAKATHLERAMDLLEALAAGGFVELAGGSEAPAAAAGPRPTAAGPDVASESDGAQPLEVLKRNACAQIERLMGPDGDPLALKIEKAANREEFFAEARKVHAAMSSFLGARKAEAFAKALGL